MRVKSKRERRVGKKESHQRFDLKELQKAAMFPNDHLSKSNLKDRLKTGCKKSEINHDKMISLYLFITSNKFEDHKKDKGEDACLYGWCPDDLTGEVGQQERGVESQ